MCNLRIAGTANDSIVDGTGIRFTVFTQGCPHKCEGCHNPETHAFDGGSEITIDELFEKIKANPLLDGVTFSGGEPMCQTKALKKLAEKIRSIGLNIWIYSGYTFEEIIADAEKKSLLEMADVLVDGRFEEKNRTLDLLFRGSVNQRIIKVAESLEKSTAVLWEEN